MKKYILFILLLIPLLFIKIPKYIELNNLAIIDRVYISCYNNKYNVKLREIIPIKDDNGIEYDYKYYKGTGNNINTIIKNINNKTKKKLFYKHIEKVYSNCINKKEFLNILKDK